MKCEPWTITAKHKLAIEGELRQIADLDYVIVRPAMVYGPGDRTGLSKYHLKTLVVCSMQTSQLKLMYSIIYFVYQLLDSSLVEFINTREKN